MICYVCNLNKATIHIQEIFNDNLIEEKHVCRECANKLNLFEENAMFDISSIDVSRKDKISPTLNDLTDIEDDFIEKNIVCEKCSTTLLKFLRTKNIGCPNCYLKFESYIKLYLKESMFANEHIGKKPNQNIDIIIKRQEKIELEKKLHVFISNEDYENAAIIRDYIATLK